MLDKIFIITANDTLITLEEWQSLYGLKACSNQIGKFFFADEAIFARDLKDYGKLYVAEPLIRVADEFRIRINRPLTFNSFNRDDAKQASLKEQGLRAATTSPHVVKLAADIDTKTKDETLKFVPIILKAAKDLGIIIRLGYIDYMKASKATPHGQTFIHLDVTPEYYAKGKPRHKQPHPLAWESPYLIW